MANKEKLFTEFTAPTTQEWLDKIEVDLKGAGRPGESENPRCTPW